MPLGDAISAFLKEAGLSTRKQNQNNAVFEAWNEAFSTGEARPVAFRNRTLHLEVTSTSVLQDLKSYTGDRFRRKANELLGDEKIRKLVVKLRSR